MRVIKTGGEYANVLRLLNESVSMDELAKHLNKADLGKEAPAVAEAIAARKREGGGILRSENDLAGALSKAVLDRLVRYEAGLATSVELENERRNFTTLLLSNPNYFGTLPGTGLPPVLPMKGNTTYEELTCLGLNTPIDRLEAVIHIKKSFGYSGGICTNGSIEWVRFFVDLHDNGVFHNVGLGSVRVYDVGGQKPLCYAVYKDFKPIRRLCTTENIVRVRAILSWNSIPPFGDPNHAPVWGNVMDVMVQIRPRFFIDFGDIVAQIPVGIPDPIGPVIKQIDPAFQIPLPAPAPLSFAEKKRVYVEAKVPVHRFAFAEAKQMLAAGTATSAELKASPLTNIGLTATEIGELVGALQQADGNTSFEELKCVGLKPEKDMFEAVFTIKKPFGYSGSLCKEGSTEYVAFWADFNDGSGFTYIDTAAMQVHDLQQVGNGVEYAVYVKKDLSKYLIPCEAGARLVRVRAILSWEDSPPPGNPNFVPFWGNREECLVQIRPGEGELATLLEIDDVAVPDINLLTGLASGSFVEAGGLFSDAPFGQTIAIAGTIGLGADFFGGPASPLKYRFEVRRDQFGTVFEPVIATFKLNKIQKVNGFTIQCALGETICEFDQAPLPAAGEGGESGWYLYHEDLIGPFTQEILSDVLMQWPTGTADEGRWKVRLHVKDAANTHYFGDEVTVRIDNTPPTAVLTLTSATFNGNPLPALECGKFPVGTVLQGTFSAHDPGTSSSAAEFQHHRVASLTISPGGPANGVTPTTNPPDLTYNLVPTTGVDGTWTLDTAGMDPCGYVLRLDVFDRTIRSAGNAVGFHDADDFGFCLE